jgi:hypothetical protein
MIRSRTIIVALSRRSQMVPTICSVTQPQHGGQVKIDDVGYIVGAPDLVAEVSASTVNDDLHLRLQVFERTGVREYVIWRDLDRQIE